MMGYLTYFITTVAGAKRRPVNNDVGAISGIALSRLNSAPPRSRRAIRLLPKRVAALLYTTKANTASGQGREIG